ncbi:fatty acid--CoA ligase family protein [Micromonospora sp. CPCC 205539]|uniref:class I adenylate-forming enzyme family protein n=1 Tax=Micromonospora sp. CPCC 205539 TaxID=3122408 RepID=UPI002FF0494B
MRTELGSALRTNARRYGGQTALTVYQGRHRTSLSWADLERKAQLAATRCGELFPQRHTILYAVDNTVAGLTGLLGVLLAGVDVAVFESGSRQLRDPGSVFYAAGTRTLVTSDTTGQPDGYEIIPVDRLVAPDGRVPSSHPHPAGEVHVYQATSGSTGESRLARQPLSNLVRGGTLYRDIYGITPDDVIVAAVPAAHSFGMVGGLFAAIVSGAALTMFTQFNPRGLATAVEESSVLLGTPLVYELVTRTVHPRPSRLRLALSSGGAISADVAAAAGKRLGTRVLQVYGSTETGLIACQRPTDRPWPADCVGLPAGDAEFRFDDGRLLVRTTTMFRGYLGESSPPPTFHDTGDLAVLDEDGRLFLRGRRSAFINVGGRKVNTARVQRVVAEYPGLAESAVYGADSLGGQEVHVAIVLTGGGSVAELIAHCRTRLAAYEVPHRVHELSRLPRTGMGKVDLTSLPGRSQRKDG